MADAPFVYLDWAATAPLSLEAARAMAPYLEAGMAGLVQGNGNANALHTAGRDAFKTLEAAGAISRARSMRDPARSSSPQERPKRTTLPSSVSSRGFWQSAA